MYQKRQAMLPATFRWPQRSGILRRRRPKGRETRRVLFISDGSGSSGLRPDSPFPASLDWRRYEMQERPTPSTPRTGRPRYRTVTEKISSEVFTHHVAPLWSCVIHLKLVGSDDDFWEMVWEILPGRSTHSGLSTGGVPLRIPQVFGSAIARLPMCHGQLVVYLGRR